MANTSLHNATKAKEDEFYTRYEDIQNELNHYEKYFVGKTVLCNCDDPYESNFCKFFLRNFNYLKLKRLICTSYNSSPFAGTQISLFDIIEGTTEQGHGYVLDVTSVPMKNGRGVSDEDIDRLLRSKKVVKELKGNGDFRSDECIEYLKQADIVVSNPPFSLFREYLAQLVQYHKQFLIIGNMNAITYKEVFPLIRDNKVWLGCRGLNKDMYFDVPDARKKWLVENKKEGSAYKIVNGIVMGRLASACWFTNLDIEKRHEKIVLYKKYTPEEYPTYDNYPAINVDKVTDIPMDYNGVMGVPITFMDKYNPDQFEIVGLAPERLSEQEASLQIKRYINAIQHKADGTTCSGNKVNDGPVLVHEGIPAKYPYYTSETVPNKYLEVLYARILIRRKE